MRPLFGAPRLVGTTNGEDITFVTIIPRLDGSLGFVAAVPDDGHVLPRRTLVERLEAALAGRAVLHWWGLLNRGDR